MKIFDTRNMPWPSDTPRNFATEPATWYDFVIAENEIGLDDCLFEFEYNNPADLTAISYIFQHPGYSGLFNIFYSVSDNLLYIGSSNLIQGVSRWTGVATPYVSAGKHKISIARVDGTLTIIADGTILQNVTGIPVAYTSTVAPISNQNGNILSCKLTDLTIGKILWSYPTWAEGKRLLAYNNVRTDRGVFEEAVSGNWSIATPLVLTGNPLESTMIFDVEFDRFVYAGSTLYQTICRSGASSTVTIYIRTLSTGYDIVAQVIASRTDGTPVTLGVSANADGLVGTRARIVVSVSAAGGYFRLYEDGALLSQYSLPSTVGSTYNTSYNDGFTLGSAYSATSAHGVRLHKALIFNYAMTAAEIAQFK